MKPLSKEALDAGRRACAQLVRVVSSATSAPLQRAAAGSALAQLHALLKKEGYVVLESFEDVRTTISALVVVYSASLREVATPIATVVQGPCAAAKDQAQLEESKDGPGPGTPQPMPHSLASDAGSGRDDSCSAVSGCGEAGGAHGAAGPSPEDWVPLLVDSSALVANCLYRGILTTANPTAAASVSDADLQLQQATPLYACSRPTMASALLQSDALPALSRLLSAEAQRGPARALLTPSQLATCLQPLKVLIAAADKYHGAMLPASPQWLRQPQPPAPNSPSTTTATATTPSPSPVPPTPAPTSHTSTPPAAGPSNSLPAAAKLSQQGIETCPGPPCAPGGPTGSAAAPVPQGHDPTTSTTSPAFLNRQTLGTALVCAVAESGVVEAACKAAMGAVEQGAGGRQQQQQQQQRRNGPACVSSGDRKLPVIQLSELQCKLFDLLWNDDDDAPLLQEPLRAILAGPCMQYALAAHAVSQLHAVDGGTTYGLPYDSLMPPVREKGKAALSCSGTINAVYWWTRTCDSGASRVLLPHGLFELCLRTVGVAADCWQRRNGLPVAAAAVAAAGGSVGDNSSSSSSSSSSSGNAASCEGQHGQGKAAPGAAEVETGRLARLCHPGGTGSAAGVSRISPAAAGPPRVTLEPSECPELAIQAMACSRVLMEGSCRAGAGARAGGRAGSEAGEAHAAVLEETGSGGCGDAAREACSSGSSSGSGSGSKDPGSWLRDGGPLARRWWRAAVAAVHCVMDELVGSKDEARSVYQVLDPSLAMPVSDPGAALPTAPPPGLSAALDAGYLPCLERTLRTCFRSCNMPSDAMRVCGGLFGDDGEAAWPLLLAFGDEREAAALLATAAKVARRTCAERARPSGDRKTCAVVMAWLEGVSSYLWRAADHVAVRIADERGLREGSPSVPVEEQGRETADAGVGDGGSSGGGKGGGGGGGGGGNGGGGNGGGDGGGGGGNGGGGKGGGDGGGGKGCGDGSGDGGGNAGGEIHVNSNNDHSRSGGGGGGGSRGDGRGVRRSAGDIAAGAGACDMEGGVRSSSGGSCEGGGGGGDRESGNDGCSDGLGRGGSIGGGSTDGSGAALASGRSGCGTAAAAATAAINAAASAATTAAYRLRSSS